MSLYHCSDTDGRRRSSVTASFVTSMGPCLATLCLANNGSETDSFFLERCSSLGHKRPIKEQRWIHL